MRGGACICSPNAIRTYRRRLSGPLLDRIDIALRMNRVTAATGEGEITSARAREQVIAARERARGRLAGTPWRRNAEVPGAWLRRDGPRIPRDGTQALDRALSRGAITLRAYDRILRVAWTLCDLAGRERPTATDVGQALFLKAGADA